MSYLPLSGAEVCSMMNLPSDMATNPLWAVHNHEIMAMLTQYALEDAMDAATAETAEGDAEDAGVSETEYYHPLRLAFAYLMLSQTASLLNLKTIGEGIVKSVGMDSAATELLTGNEIEQFSNAMELKGLKALGIYISAAGTSRMRELLPSPKRFKIAVI